MCSVDEIMMLFSAYLIQTTIEIMEKRLRTDTSLNSMPTIECIGVTVSVYK